MSKVKDKWKVGGLMAKEPVLSTTVDGIPVVNKITAGDE